MKGGDSEWDTDIEIIPAGTVYVGTMDITVTADALVTTDGVDTTDTMAAVGINL